MGNFSCADFFSSGSMQKYRGVTMGAKKITSDQVPAFGTIKKIIAEIGEDLSIEATGLDFDRDEYVIKLKSRDRTGRACLCGDLLNDIRDDNGMLGQEYTLELQEKLTSVIREAISKMA